MSLTTHPVYPDAGNTMAPRRLGQITDLIYHHSAGGVDQTPLEIDAEHRARGMAMIGYNYLIAKDGTVYAGRPLNYIPAASYGRNTQSVNVCVLGNFQHDDPGYTGPVDPRQVVAANELAVHIHALLPSIERTIGHRDVATMFYPNNTAPYSTACPGDMFYSLIPAIRLYVKQNLHDKL